MSRCTSKQPIQSSTGIQEISEDAIYNGSMREPMDSGTVLRQDLQVDNSTSGEQETTRITRRRTIVGAATQYDRPDTRASKRRKTENTTASETIEIHLTTESKEGKRVRRSGRVGTIRWNEEERPSPDGLVTSLQHGQVAEADFVPPKVTSKSMSESKLATTTTTATNQKHPESHRWVKLSHLGHVSDYHGFQRKYDSFLPLSYSKSLTEMNDAIASTLQKNQIDQTIESDEEVEEENEILRRVMSRYQEKAETEKALKQISKKQTISVKPINDLITRPIIFDGNWKQSLQDCNLGVNCDICIPDKLLSHPRKGKNHGSFREVEFDPMEFSTSDEHACSNGRGNRSRQIAAQRAASVLLLSEIRHRLNFISTYNQAFNNDCEMSKHEISGSQGMEKSPTGEPSKKKTNREASGKPSVRKSQTYKEMQRQLPVHNNSSLARLPYEKIFEDFQVMMQKNFVPLTSHPQILTISALQESILAAIEEQPECEWEEGDLEEHKTYLRAIRTYSGKADQERIEKRQHDEERELQLRELHYKNRGRKASAEEMELLNMESRPIIFGSSCEKNSCKLGNSCTICRGGCAQMLEPDTGVILHPAYKRVEGMFLDSDFKTDARRSRTRERFQQRELAVESLKRLHHRISFIQQYNNGWMITEKRRK